jgi:DNA-binding MarR family transcriptional regulator
MSPPRDTLAATEALLRHWREAVPNDRLAHLVRDAARGLTLALHMRLAAHGVSFGHWIFLRALWEEEDLTQRALAERAGLTEATISFALAAMQRLGIMRREPRVGSRRKLAVFLTRNGRGLKRRLCRSRWK